MALPLGQLSKSELLPLLLPLLALLPLLLPTLLLLKPLLRALSTSEANFWSPDHFLVPGADFGSGIDVHGARSAPAGWGACCRGPLLDPGARF